MNEGHSLEVVCDTGLVGNFLELIDKETGTSGLYNLSRAEQRPSLVPEHPRSEY